MPTHRRYTWEHRPADPLDAGTLAARCALVLLEACTNRPQFFSEPQVTGSLFGILQFSITISSKDQWRVRWRARKLLSDVQLGTDVPITLISEVSVLRREPHNHPNRGARWQLRRLPSSTRTDSP
jgi:hypothetical protein